MLIAVPLILVPLLVVAPDAGEETIQVTISDFQMLADDGILGDRTDVQRIWGALRAKHAKRMAEVVAIQEQADADGMGGAMRDLRRLLSMTNLLYCIATTLLTAVFSFLMIHFSERSAPQALIAIGYGAVFVYWGMKLLALGVVSDHAAKGSSGSPFVGGVLLLLPIVAAVPVGSFLVEVATGLNLRHHSWIAGSMPLEAVLVNGQFCFSCLIMAGCICAYSTTLYFISGFPLLLIPLLGTIYIIVIVILLTLVKELIAIVWGSMGYSLVLWCLAHSGLVSSDVRLGMLISACNSGFWSFPYMLCIGKSTGGLRKLFRNSSIDKIMAELWAKPYLIVSLVCYSFGNAVLLYYGLQIQSWVPVPYALTGVVVTMILGNYAPPRTRVMWRALYNLPMAILLLAVSGSYGRITDARWLGVLSWLGQPHHFRLFGIVIVRGQTLICAMWSLWYGLSRWIPSRILKDLKEQQDAIEVRRSEIKKLQESIENYNKEHRVAADQDQAQQSPGMFSSIFSRIARQPCPPPLSREDLETLKAQLATLQRNEASMSKYFITARRWLMNMESSGLLALGSIPLCWIGFSISAAVSDAPEPFSVLAFLLDINASWYIARAFGGMIFVATSRPPLAHPPFPEWRGDVPLSVALPALIIFGVRIVAVSQNSVIRTMSGLHLLVAGLGGLIHKRGALISASVSVGIMAFGLLCDSQVLVFVAVISLYSVGVYFLCTTIGKNVLSLVCGITLVALGTMYLGMSFESYFVAYQAVAGGAMPFGGTLRALVAFGGVEKRLSLKLVRVFEKCLVP